MKGIVISDIHVGAFDVNILYEEIKEGFIKYIDSLKELDFLIINGDFFDGKLFLNDVESSVAYKIMSEILDVCKKHNTKVRIVYGTEFHEWDQYKVLTSMDVYPDIKVIKHVCEEELFEDFHILYIPEEYVYSKSEIYDKYLSKENYYDYVFGHGVIKEVMKEAALSYEKKEKDSKKSAPPVFTSSELMYCTKGQAIFGHYHINQNIDDKVFYVGSYSRWQYGEEEPKGFYEITKKKSKYEIKFIENQMARTFVTMGFGYDNEVFDDFDKLKGVLDRADGVIKNNTYDNIRLMFNIPENMDNPESFINYIKERYKFNDKFKVVMTNGYIEKKKEDRKKAIEDDNDKYEFIEHYKETSLEEVVGRFIAIEYGKDIPNNLICSIMNDNLSDIIGKYDKIDIEQKVLGKEREE